MKSIYTGRGGAGEICYLSVRRLLSLKDIVSLDCV